MQVTPYNSLCSKHSKTTKKCFALAKLKVKNQKQSSVNQSNKEANSNKQKVVPKKMKMGQNLSFEIRFFEFIFGKVVFKDPESVAVRA